MQTLANYIDGQLVAPQSGSYLENINPATGTVYSKIPDSNDGDINAAVAAAARAFPTWSQTPAEERSACMMRVAQVIEDKLDDFVAAECDDNGKPLWLARTVDIPRAVKNLRFFATAILHTRSDLHETDGQAINYTLRRPRGVAGLISPWNLPLYLFTWKIAPAVATGNTAVGKPSEVTPVTAHLLAEACIEAEFPPGVLNIVHGTGATAGAPLVAHPQVPTVSFTGGTVTGREIARTAAPMFKKYSLELGGKNPNIVFADADFDKALNESVRAAFANQGQICLCGSRLFVERSIYDRFVERFVAVARTMTVGDPHDLETKVGALVSKTQYEKVLSYIQLARDEGGTILCGGSRPDTLPERCRNGYFISPTVITGLDHLCRVNQEEIFGPVVSIMPFDSDDSVIEMANSTPYGLSASLWTQNLTRAHHVAEQLQAGTVWINCWLLRDLRVPFGGVKQSGVGREGGDEAMRFFTEPKNVCVAK